MTSEDFATRLASPGGRVLCQSVGTFGRLGRQHRRSFLRCEHIHGQAMKVWRQRATPVTAQCCDVSVEVTDGGQFVARSSERRWFVVGIIESRPTEMITGLLAP